MLTRNVKLLMIIAIIFFLITGCTNGSMQEMSENNIKDNLEIHFLDVGQADSILILMPNGEVSLIDGGNIDDGDYIVDYIKKLGITKIDYLLATHPHEDHIGGLPAIIKAFDIKEIYMPKKEQTTNIFNELIDEIRKKGLKVNEARGGINIVDKEDFRYFILSPTLSEYNETNDYSIVSKIIYKNTSFLFTGDAEEPVERELLNKNLDLSADLIKIGHHGGRTSTDKEFLDKVNPAYGVISVGNDNEYGHPHDEVLERLKAKGVSIFRTDEIGTIKCISDGNKITFNKTPIKIADSEKKEDNESNKVDYYIGNKNTKVYHQPSCNSLPDKKNQVIINTKKEAEEQGFKPHKSCIE